MTAKAQSLRPAFDRLRKAWRGTPLPGFLCWWGTELRASLPARWREWVQPGAQWLLLTPLNDRDVLLHRAGANTPRIQIDTTTASELQRDAVHQASAGIDPVDLRLALCLPSSAVLRRQLTLPAAARTDLQRVMGYEMDRQTPFRVADVYYDVRELSPASGGRIDVELLVTPRARIDPLLHDLAAAGIHVDAVDVVAGDTRAGANLLPSAQRPSHANPQGRVNLVLFAALALLLALAMGQWLHNRREALTQMQTQVDALHTQAREVLALRRQLGENVGAAGFLAQRKLHSPSMIDLLDSVTRRLPDDTWLERLGVEDNQLGMRGQSPQATRLLKRMQGARQFGEASFQGVITTDPNTSNERFYMVAPVDTPARAASTATATAMKPGSGEDAHARAQAR